MALPILLSDSQQLSQMQTLWSAQLNPLLANPLMNGIHLYNISLSTGANVVNHRLGRRLQGWVLTRKRAAGDLYDTQETNTMPTLTLTLNASASMVVDLYVY